MEEDFRLIKKVQLSDASMIIGLSGWGNAGEISTFTVRYLLEKFHAEKFGEIQTENFHDYFIERPLVSTEKGLIKVYMPPKNEFFYAKSINGKEDIVFLIGAEPHLNWPRYSEAVIKVAKETNVKRIYTIGGYLADMNYQTEPPITGSTNKKTVINELKKNGVELTDYTGPTSIYSEILWQAMEEGLDAISLWSAIPMDIVGLYPRATYLMLKALAPLVGIDTDLSDLEKRAKSFEAKLETETMSQLQQRRIIEDLKKSGQDRETTYIS